jgi:hypothetical protein
MRLIKPSVEIINTESEDLLNKIYKQIELAGRTAQGHRRSIGNSLSNGERKLYIR